MISIFKKLDSFAASGSAPMSSLPNRVLTAIVGSFRLHMLRAKSLNHTAVLEDFDRILGALDTRAQDDQVLEHTNRASASLQEYFQLLGKGIDSAGYDLSTSIRALAVLLQDGSGDQDQTLSKMEQIRDQFQGGHSLDDVYALRRHLDACLVNLRGELTSARQKQRANAEQQATIFAQLNRGMADLRSTVPRHSPDGAAICILRLRRYAGIRDRYGEDIARRLSDYVIQLLLVKWPAANDITPYSGECIVVVDNRNLDLEFHRAALRRLASERIMLNASFEGRDIAIPVAIDWTVVRAPANNDIEAFIASFLEGMAQKDSQAASLDQVLGGKA